jgi:hypothetical protein
MLFALTWVLACAAATAQQKPAYQVVAPEIVAQGEEFTLRVVEATDKGPVPIPSGAEVLLNGVALPAEAGGKVQAPAFIWEAGNQFLVITVRVGAEETYLQHHVEVIRLPHAPQQPPQISHVAEFCPPGGNLRVEGQALDNLRNAGLKGTSATYPLGDSVGSSLQRIYTPTVDLPKDTFHFVAQDASGRPLEAPNATTNPTLTITGTQIRQRGQRGQFVVKSDFEGDVQLSGGEPNIRLDSHNVHVAPGKPGTVSFTALVVGNYNVDAVLQAPDAPPANSPPADASVGELHVDFNPGDAKTTVRAPITITGEQGQPVANTAVEVALAGPQGIQCSRITTDKDGHATFLATVPGQVAADALAVHCYRVAGHPWNRNKKRKQQPPRYQYAVKFVCGSPEFPVVAPGRYFTAINVHNPGDQPARLQKKVAVALPGEKAGPVSRFFQAQLRPDEALEIDCPDILRHAQLQEFLKGFVVIESQTLLDVVAVYTAGHTPVETLDIERVPPRRVMPVQIVPPLLGSRIGF